MINQTASITALGDTGTCFRLASLASESGDGYWLQDQASRLPAMLAFSCVIKPRPGDQVLYASTVDGHNIIVSIVSREGDQAMAIEFPGDARLNSRDGSISLASDKSLSMSSPRMNMISGTMVQKSDQSYLQVREMHARGERLNASIDNIAVLSKLISTMARQAIGKFVTYIRRSEQFDQVKSAQMTRSVDGLYAMNSKQTVMQSEKDTRIDGERIHIG